MKTFLQLLRAAFWMLPLQRGMTLLGAAVCLIALTLNPVSNVFNLPGSSLPMAFSGFALMMVIPMVAGGAIFRMLSTPRAILLLPRARGRLLTGMIGIVMLTSLLWIFAYWWVFQHEPARFRPDAEQYLMMYVLTLTFATECAIGVFVASRGPVWALVVLGAWQLPGMVMRLAGVDDVPRLLTGPVGLAIVPVAWLVFGVWYLRTRRVNAAGWTRVATAASSGTTSRLLAAGMTREQAMSRWLLGASTPFRISLQWFLGVAVLIGVQLLIGRDSPPHAVAAMAFGTLSFAALVMGAVAWSIAGRSRGLWLNGGRLRGELHGWCERLMLKVTLAIALPFIALGVALWWWLPERPALPGAYLFLAMLSPGVAAAWFGLMQVQRRVVIDVIGGVAIAAGWYYGLVQPLYVNSGQGNWPVLAAMLVLIVVLRQLAAWRWRGADWLRAQRLEPMS